jgi:hypothetical protein
LNEVAPLKVCTWETRVEKVRRGEGEKEKGKKKRKKGKEREKGDESGSSL